jgi:hypothetical protein
MQAGRNQSPSYARAYRFGFGFIEYDSRDRRCLNDDSVHHGPGAQGWLQIRLEWDRRTAAHAAIADRA